MTNLIHNFAFQSLTFNFFTINRILLKTVLLSIFELNSTSRPASASGSCQSTLAFCEYVKCFIYLIYYNIFLILEFLYFRTKIFMQLLFAFFNCLEAISFLSSLQLKKLIPNGSAVILTFN